MFELRYSNDLSPRGVKEGSNMVNVHVDHLGTPVIERVELLAGSSVDFTALPPPPHSARVDEPFDVRLVDCSSGQPIRQVRFSTTPSSPSVEIAGAVPALERAHDETVVVRAKGTLPRTYIINVVAGDSLGGSKTAQIPVEIRP